MAGWKMAGWMVGGEWHGGERIRTVRATEWKGRGENVTRRLFLSAKQHVDVVQLDSV